MALVSLAQKTAGAEEAAVIGEAASGSGEQLSWVFEEGDTKSGGKLKGIGGYGGVQPARTDSSF